MLHLAHQLVIIMIVIAGCCQDLLRHAVHFATVQPSYCMPQMLCVIARLLHGFKQSNICDICGVDNHLLSHYMLHITGGLTPECTIDQFSCCITFNIMYWPGLLGLIL
jgi:hypothetical protein